MRRVVPKINYAKMRELYDAKYRDKEISRILGCSVPSVCAWRAKNKLMPNGGLSSVNTYVVYIAKTDEVVANGTLEECARQLGLRDGQGLMETISKTKSGQLSRYVFVEFEDEQYKRTIKNKRKKEVRVDGES